MVSISLSLLILMICVLLISSLSSFNMFNISLTSWIYEIIYNHSFNVFAHKFDPLCLFWVSFRWLNFLLISELNFPHSSSCLENDFFFFSVLATVPEFQRTHIRKAFTIKKQTKLDARIIVGRALALNAASWFLSLAFQMVSKSLPRDQSLE